MAVAAISNLSKVLLEGFNVVVAIAIVTEASCESSDVVAMVTVVVWVFTSVIIRKFEPACKLAWNEFLSIGFKCACYRELLVLMNTIHVTQTMLCNKRNKFITSYFEFNFLFQCHDRIFVLLSNNLA